MSRIPALPRDQLSPDGQKLHDRFEEALGGGFKSMFTIKREADGALLGPLPFWLHDSAMGDSLLHYMPALAKLPGLSPEARETAILVVGSHFKAAYELYAHANVANKSTSLSEAQVEQVAKGQKPSDLDDASSIAFDVALYLSSRPGPLPQSLWDRSHQVLGKDGTVSLVHYAGFYAYTCMILNAMDAPVPEG